MLRVFKSLVGSYIFTVGKRFTPMLLTPSNFPCFLLFSRAHLLPHKLNSILNSPCSPDVDTHAILDDRSWREACWKAIQERFLPGLKKEIEKETETEEKELWSPSLPSCCWWRVVTRCMDLLQPSCCHEVGRRVTEMLNHSSIHWMNSGHTLSLDFLVSDQIKPYYFSQVLPDCYLRPKHPDGFSQLQITQKCSTGTRHLPCAKHYTVPCTSTSLPKNCLQICGREITKSQRMTVLSWRWERIHTEVFGFFLHQGTYDLGDVGVEDRYSRGTGAIQKKNANMPLGSLLCKSIQWLNIFVKFRTWKS